MHTPNIVNDCRNVLRNTWQLVGFRSMLAVNQKRQVFLSCDTPFQGSSRCSFLQNKQRRERERADGLRATKFLLPNIRSNVHPFCQIWSSRIRSLTPAHTHGQGDTQACECQEVQAISETAYEWVSDASCNSYHPGSPLFCFVFLTPWILTGLVPKAPDYIWPCPGSLLLTIFFSNFCQHLSLQGFVLPLFGCCFYFLSQLCVTLPNFKFSAILFIRCHLPKDGSITEMTISWASTMYERSWH